MLKAINSDKVTKWQRFPCHFAASACNFFRIFYLDKAFRFVAVLSSVASRIWLYIVFLAFYEGSTGDVLAVYMRSASLGNFLDFSQAHRYRRNLSVRASDKANVIFMLDSLVATDFFQLWVWRFECIWILWITWINYSNLNMDMNMNDDGGRGRRSWLNNSVSWINNWYIRDIHFSLSVFGLNARLRVFPGERERSSSQAGPIELVEVTLGPKLMILIRQFVTHYNVD